LFRAHLQLFANAWPPIERSAAKIAALQDAPQARGYNVSWLPADDTVAILSSIPAFLIHN
jgi:hypothetical protein